MTAIITPSIMPGGAPMVFARPSAQQNTALRAPTVADDVTRGNTVGRLWLDRTTKHIYENTDNTASAAVWSDLGAFTTRPADASGITWLGLYGLKALKSTYLSGACINVLRNSDAATTTINFIAGDIDILALTNFLSGTFGWVTQWYNHNGSSNHAVPPVGNRPTIRVVGGRVTIAAANIVEQGTDGSGAYFGLPSFGFNMSALSIIAVIKPFMSSPLPSTGVGGAQNNLFGIYDGSTGLLFGQSTGATGGDGEYRMIELAYFGPGYATFTTETSDTVIGLSQTGSNATIFQNEQVAAGVGNGAFGSVTATSSIGSSNAASGGYYALNSELQAFMIVGDTALSLTQQRNTKRSLYALFEVAPQYMNDSYTMVSHSIGAGYQAAHEGSQGWSATSMLQGALIRPVRISNFSVSQATIAYHVSHYANRIGYAAGATPKARNTVHFDLAANNVGATPGDGAAAFSALVGLITTAQVDHANVIVSTMATNGTCDSNAAAETERQSFNSLVLVNATVYGYYVVNIGGSGCNLGVPGATASHPELFAGDLLHWSKAGQDVAKALTATLYNSILTVA